MHIQQRHIRPLFITSCIARVLCLLICFSLLSSVPAYADSAIGKATLVIGTAYIENQGKKQRLKSGDAIYGARQIITSTNGHVHIRFNDQGLISVRPNSQLSIEEYDYNRVNPSQSTVKFSLIRGSTRSVSGKAAQSAKQRFRMNTPIAAIGVRGTDFVVRTDQLNIQAIVNEGAIIVAPFSDQCSAAALGPCAKNSVVLRGDSQQLLQFNQLLALPQLLPATPAQLQNQLLNSPDDTKDNKASDNQKNASTESELANTENSTNRQAGANKESTLAYNENSAKDSLSNTFVSNTQMPTAIPTAPEPIQNTPASLPVDFTPSQKITTQQLASKQLVWGRWGSALPIDKIAVASATAIEGRKVTVGLSSFGLFRSGNTERIAKDLGYVSFSLNSAQANYLQGAEVSAMRVEGGLLNIDFNSEQFNTTLNLQHSATGKINFNAEGSINQQGFFISRTPTQQLGGAVSTDGKEAGYFFSKDVGASKIEGITLWGAK